MEGRRLGGAWEEGEAQWARFECVYVLRTRQVNPKEGWSKVLGKVLEKGPGMWLWERTGPRLTPGSVARGTEVGCSVSCLLTHGRRWLEIANNTVDLTSCCFNCIISLRYGCHHGIPFFKETENHRS